MITAEVTEWPGDADESHAEALLEFDPAEWGLGQPSPKVMHLPSEDTEGGSHDCPKTIAKNALNTSAKRGKNAKTDTRRMLRRANDVV